ncbi:uncharacterized protein LOC113234336 [Hyposmocoma kahamanoa]|uniref:uncharacterized protein LOC113234336 n=1 Tax=Hyposmocoma kahamanoa TaxID=1477025 RepID=UPI000E6D7E31|nr:uncharacterized protein LOC113234336 [Hyposmocoma kahamanoa]
MPLYPDEMNNILPKLPENPTYQGSIQLPQTIKTVQSDADESGIGDIQYMEDYLENNRDKLDKMAQAYSDYGVLEEKKVCKEGKNDAAKEINKMSTKKRSIMDEQYYTKVNKHGRPHVAITKPMPAPPQHSTFTTSDPLSVESDSPKPEDIDIVFKNKDM